MDPELRKGLNAFKNKALSNISITSKKRSAEDDKPEIKVVKKHKSKAPLDYKHSAGASQGNFAVLHKIIQFMKQRHHHGDTQPIGIDDILDETEQQNITPRTRQWLITEALVSNPKIDIINGNQYVFKPKLPIRDRKSLLRLLERHDQKGEGGILLDDVNEALPNADKALQVLGDQIISITRAVDKKKVIFYYDKSCTLEIDEELKKLWRSVAVEGIDEMKVEDHLKNQGITVMRDITTKTVAPKQKRKAVKRPKAKIQNEHVGEILKDYS